MSRICRFCLPNKAGIFQGMNRMFLAILILGVTVIRTQAETILFAANFSDGISNGWQNVAFFKTPTDYRTVREGTNFVLLAVAEKTCSALSAKLNLVPATNLLLRWRWRIDGVATNGSERDLAKFDHAARVFVAFDTLIGPPRTLNYLWANTEPVGASREHPKSSRAQLIVVESGNAKAGQWVSEERDVSADWKRAFPDRAMPKLVGLGVMTDSDSLGQKLTGAYADIELLAK